MKQKMEGERNRKYILENRYKIQSANEMFQFDQAVMELTKKSARISVTMGNTTLCVFVYCRTNTSKVYKTASRLGFVEL